MSSSDALAVGSSVGTEARLAEVVAAEYSPEKTARYRTEIQVLLFGLFDDFLKKHEPRLYDVLQSARALDAHEGALLLKALQSVGIRFQLSAIANEIAETRQIRMTEMSDGPDAIIGSFHRSLGRAAAAGRSAAEVGDALAKLEVVPTITANPTEAKRVSILENHRSIYRRVVDLETDRWTTRERKEIVGELSDLIALLWMTGELRLEPPTLDEEVSWGLHFFNETLFDGALSAGVKLKYALQTHYPDSEAALPAFLKFRSWIGGDRDGLPNVDVAATRRTLSRHQSNAVGRYIVEIDRLAKILSISEHVRPPTDQFRERLASGLEASGDAERIGLRNPHEPYRQFCVTMHRRLSAILDDGDQNASRYGSPQDFIADLQAFEAELTAIGAGTIASGKVASLRFLVSTFGFRTAALDIRENAEVIKRAVAEIGGAGRDLRSDLASGTRLDIKVDKLSAEVRETVELFQMLGEIGHDPEAVGSFVLSMTTSTEDILSLIWLAHAVGVRDNFPPIVPLFERIEDLRLAPSILNELLSDTTTRPAICGRDGAVEVMLGYSDANRDGGCLASVWEISEAQRAIIRTCADHDVNARFLHGRGGAITRGGAPTGRAIAAQPAGAVNGKLHVVEHGEVVSAKYSNRGTARTHLELLGASALTHTMADARRDTEPSEHAAVVEALSSSSLRCHRDLVDTPGFLTYFREASPIDELSLLKFGWVPSETTDPDALKDMRMIPWVFGWSQNRHLIHGWYGLGTAITEVIEENGLEAVQECFKARQLFGGVVDEAEKSLYQADIGIAERYATLVNDTTIRETVFGKIKDEHTRTVSALLDLTGESNLADRFPNFRRRIDEARPLIDRCNAWQVNLMRQYRSESVDRRAQAPLLLSMNCISTGLGWTG